jgi:hypothetical protein
MPSTMAPAQAQRLGLKSLSLPSTDGVVRMLDGLACPRCGEALKPWHADRHPDGAFWRLVCAGPQGCHAVVLSDEAS